MTIVKIEWQNNRKQLLIWMISLMVTVSLLMSLFPSMANSGMKEIMTNQLNTLPENMLKAFHLNTGPSLVEPTGFFAYVFQYVFMAASFYAIMLGSKMLIKEESEGTIEYLYAQPISRTRIVVEKGIAAASMLLIFWLMTYVTSLGMTLFLNKGITSQKEILTSLSNIFMTEFFVLLFFMSIGFLLSSIVKRVNQGLSMGVVFLFYIGGIMGDLNENLSFLKSLSPMAQANPAEILVKGMDGWLIATLILVSLISLIVTIFIYKRKDLKV